MRKHKLRRVAMAQKVTPQSIIASNWPPIWNRWSSSHGLSAIAELLVAFGLMIFHVIGMSYCTRVPNLAWIEPSLAQLWYHCNFQAGSCQPSWICSRVLTDHPCSGTVRLHLVKLIVSEIYDYRYIIDCGIFGFKLPIHSHFNAVLGTHFSQTTSCIILTPRVLVQCNTSFERQSGKSIQRFDLAAGSRKRTGKDSQGKVTTELNWKQWQL